MPTPGTSACPGLSVLDLAESPLPAHGPGGAMGQQHGHGCMRDSSRVGGLFPRPRQHLAAPPPALDPTQLWERTSPNPTTDGELMPLGTLVNLAYSKGNDAAKGNAQHPITCTQGFGAGMAGGPRNALYNTQGGALKASPRLPALSWNHTEVGELDPFVPPPQPQKLWQDQVQRRDRDGGAQPVPARGGSPSAGQNPPFPPLILPSHRSEHGGIYKQA